MHSRGVEPTLTGKNVEMGLAKLMRSYIVETLPYTFNKQITL